MSKSDKYAFCPRCGYTGKIQGNACPKCGSNIGKWVAPPFFKRKIVLIPLVVLIGIIGISTYFSFTNKGVAAEFRHVRQPRPNVFYVGIDVSATAREEVLDKIKDGVISRLKQFVGDEAVSYQVDSFGNPGCGNASFRTLVSTQSPKEMSRFTVEVDERIRTISPKDAEAAAKNVKAYVTTPLHLLLEKVMKEKPGGRIIVFSDLMNDDSDCTRQYPFPEEAIIEFGKNPEGQLIFLYPSPAMVNTPELNEKTLKQQQGFIRDMQKLSGEGKIRAFFYHMPDDLNKMDFFVKFQLQNSIPVTNFDIVVERVSKVVDTIVSAVRG